MVSISVKNRISMFEPKSPEPPPQSPHTKHSSDRPSVGTKQRESGAFVSGVASSPRAPSPNNARAASFASSRASPVNVKQRPSWEWPVEDGIPAPKKSQTTPKKGDQQDKSRRYSSPFLPTGSSPVILPQKTSPVVLRQKPVVKNPPFQQHQDQESKNLFPAPTEKRKEKTEFRVVEAREMEWPSTKLARKRPKEVTVVEKQTTSTIPDDENKAPQQEFNPVASESPRPRSSRGNSRALRLMRTKRAASPSPASTMESGLKGSLGAASVVMEEEKSSAGSSSASTRSSLSNNELSSIANRALSMVKTQASVPAGPVVLPNRSHKKGPNDAPSELSEAKLSDRFANAAALTHTLSELGSETSTRAQSSLPNVRPSLYSAVRKSRTVSNVSHQQARKALQKAAQLKKEKAKKKPAESQQVKEQPLEVQQDGTEIAGRLGSKAARVLAMKNSSKTVTMKPKLDHFGRTESKKPQTDSKRDLEISTVDSVASQESTKSRRINHPAFANRASPRLTKMMERPFPDNNGEKTKQDSAKPFSEELFSSFRHFNASREMPSSSPGSSFDRSSTPLTTDLTRSFSGHQVEIPKVYDSKVNDGRPPQHVASANSLPDDLDVREYKSAQKHGSNPIDRRSPRTLRDALAQGKSSVTQTFGVAQPISTNTAGLGAPRAFSADGPVSPESDPFLEQEESLHSTSERNYERKYLENFYDMEATKVSSKQGFQEVSYLSSLSSNTFSNQTMISSVNEENRKSDAKTQGQFTSPLSGINSQQPFAFRVMTDAGNPLGELPSTMSPGQSMRSGHSLAQSMISVSPRGQTPKYNAEFDYLTNSPSRQSGVDADPSHHTSERAAPETDPMMEQFDPMMATKDQTHDGTLDNGMQVTDQHKDTILPSGSAQSDPPPGFVFHDEDTEDDRPAKENIPDPAGSSFDGYSFPENMFGDCESEAEREDVSFGRELKEGVLKADSTMEFNEQVSATGDETASEKMDTIADDSERTTDVTARGVSQHTTDSTNTISSSLRTGISSVQSVQNAAFINTGFGDEINGSDNGCGTPVDGSTSIRTGLSAMQNLPVTIANEGSTSMRSGLSSLAGVANANGAEDWNNSELNNSELSENQDSQSPKTASQHQSQHQSQQSFKYPDTIVEEDDESSAARKSKSDGSVKSGNKESTILGHSILTATTDSSSGPGSQKTATSSDGFASGSNSGSGSGSGSGSDTMGGNQTGYTDTGSSEPEGERLRPFLPPIVTRDDQQLEGASVYDTSAMSSPTSSKHSRWWKGKYGMKMPNMIKNVLSKASPRQGVTPNSQMDLLPPTGFSTDDDDDDIFDGLEEDNISNVLGETEKKNTNEAKRPLTTPKTPKQGKFFTHHSRKSESQGLNKADERETPSTPRRSVRSERTAQPKPIARKKQQKNTKAAVDKAPLALQKYKKRPSSPAAATNPNSIYSNDRSGTVVDESEVVNDVNSDITSSIMGGNGPAKSDPPKTKEMPTTPKKHPQEEKAVSEDKDEKAKSKTLKTPESTKSKSGRKSKSDKDPKLLTPSDKKSKSSSASKSGKKSKKSRKGEPEEVIAVTKAETEECDVGVESEDNPAPGYFMNMGCGLSDAFTNMCQFGAKPTESTEEVPVEDEPAESLLSGTSTTTGSQLTDLEKRIWTEWDKMDQTGKVVKPDDKKDDLNKKREVARGKLLEIASSAISSQMTMKDEQPVESADFTGASSSADSGDTGESSEESGESGVTGSSAENSRETNDTATESYYSASDSDFVSDSPSTPTKQQPRQAPPTPILLSFSQRSLVEKFSKKLASDGVEVLKLNTRKQWQVRYFTVSKEQIALVAHEAKNQSGDVAHCPKALLWLKNFNSKKGGYGITNIDKNGHGGMMLVNLVDIHVNDKPDPENPLPKKLSEKFKNSVMVALDYTINGDTRSIEFRCKDNDEGQFLCTCMRVIRDLLKREQTMRMLKSPTAPRRKK